MRGDAIVGALALEDEIRPEAQHAVAELKAMGQRVVMITGDARQVADAVGADLGVDEVIAEVLPEDKDAKVAELQARGLSVAMVGDGVNDAPALARADVGIAIGAGTDVAIESAGVILASNDPRSVVSVIRLSRASYRKMIQNLAWAAGYNVVAIPLAAGALAWAGVTLPPAVAAVLMSVSTIVVALNAQLLRRVDLRRPTIDDPSPRRTPMDQCKTRSTPTLVTRPGWAMRSRVRGRASFRSGSMVFPCRSCWSRERPGTCTWPSSSTCSIVLLDLSRRGTATRE